MRKQVFGERIYFSEILAVKQPEEKTGENSLQMKYKESFASPVLLTRRYHLLPLDPSMSILNPLMLMMITTMLQWGGGKVLWIICDIWKSAATGVNFRRWAFLMWKGDLFLTLLRISHIILIAPYDAWRSLHFAIWDDVSCLNKLIYKLTEPMYFPQRLKT